MSKALYHDSTPPPANTTTTSTSIPRLHAVSVVDDSDTPTRVPSGDKERKVRTIYLRHELWEAIDQASKEADMPVSRIIAYCVKSALPAIVRQHMAGEVVDSD